jgi:hypothetical protein
MYHKDHKHGGEAGGQIEHHRFPAWFTLGVDTAPSGADDDRQPPRSEILAE